MISSLYIFTEVQFLENMLFLEHCEYRNNLELEVRNMKCRASATHDGNQICSNGRRCGFRMLTARVKRYEVFTEKMHVHMILIRKNLASHNKRRSCGTWKRTTVLRTQQMDEMFVFSPWCGSSTTFVSKNIGSDLEYVCIKNDSNWGVCVPTHVN